MQENPQSEETQSGKWKLNVLSLAPPVPPSLPCAETEKYLFCEQKETREITWCYIVRLFIEQRRFHSEAILDTSLLFVRLQWFL